MIASNRLGFREGSREGGQAELLQSPPIEALLPVAFASKQIPGSSFSMATTRAHVELPQASRRTSRRTSSRYLCSSAEWISSDRILSSSASFRTLPAGVRDQKRQFQPFPVTVHISEPDLSQPVQLDFRTNELIGRVFLCPRSSKCLQKSPVEFDGYRCNMLDRGSPEIRPLDLALTH